MISLLPLQPGQPPPHKMALLNSPTDHDKTSSRPLVVTLLPAPTLSPPDTKHFSYDGLVCEFPTEPPAKFICSICTQVVNDPHLTACCGHEFCGSCLDQWERESNTLSCPHCRQERFVHILDKQTRREVEEMTANCPKRAQGCKWEGELKMARAHQRDCSYTQVKCQHCSMMVLRKNFDYHEKSECNLRDSECVYCRKKDAYVKVISFAHLAECPGYPMRCPNNCRAAEIKRSEIRTHRDNCPLEEIECPLKSAGCCAKILRKDLELHVAANPTQHLMQLMSGFQNTQQEVQAQRGELRELRMFKSVVSEAVERVSSDLDQLFEKSLTTELAPLRSIRSLLASSGAVVLDSKHTEISLAIPNLSQLEKRKIMSWESTQFYLGAGYKVRLVFLHRSAQSSHLAAEIRLLCGEFDGELAWPCNVDFSNLHMSFLPVSDHKRSDVVVPQPTKKALQPFCLSTKGHSYTDVARCTSPPLYHLLWQSEKVLETLPPYPSAIRGQYLQHDCLTVTLKWGDTVGQLEGGLLKMLLERGRRGGRESGGVGTSESVSERGVSVSTSAGSVRNRPIRKLRRKT